MSNTPIWRRGNSSNSSPQRVKLDKLLAEEDLLPFLVDLDDLPESLLKNNSGEYSATFIEYLRWMRAFKPETNSERNKAENNTTKLHLLQLAQDPRIANYSKFLQRACQRIENIVKVKQGKKFDVTCPWRIRVGGHRGPENILLPAFDSLGIPFIPSSSLRGIARNQAIREVMEINPELSYQEAEQHEFIIDYFGSLETKDKSKREGKVTFLDAYPIAEKCPSGGLSLDIANNVWNWGEDNLPDYQPNPNLFLSLKHPTFLIGIIPNHHCKSEQLNNVEEWLLKGLAIGAGSQVNSGYGCLTKSGNYEIDKNNQKKLLELEFSLSGQLINSNQLYDNLSNPYKTNNGEVERKKNRSPKTNEHSKPEVRPIAFKSMLRYWFRVIALGVLPQQRVKELESFIFGGIEPKHRGLIQVQLHHAEDTKPPSKKIYGEQTGELIILASPELSLENFKLLTDFFQSLTWLMLHLGSVGLGARRPLHQRPSQPFWRGSDLKFQTKESFWITPETPEDFAKQFQEKLASFFQNLKGIQDYYIRFMIQLGTKINSCEINDKKPRKASKISVKSWCDALDSNTIVLVCQGESDHKKPFALSILHDKKLNKTKKYRNRSGKHKYLCGDDGLPSPVLITNLGNYEIVVIFGASERFAKQRDDLGQRIQLNPRYRYFLKLMKSSNKSIVLWKNF